MTSIDEGPRYSLTPGNQVREEDFGLLFYTQQGPGLYFVSSGDLLGEDFFLGRYTLEEWLQRSSVSSPVAEVQVAALEKALVSLKEKGIIVVC